MLKIIATAKIKNKIYATAKIARSIISVPDYVYISVFKIDQLNNGNVIRANDNIIVDYSFTVNKPQLIGYFEVLINGNVVYTKNTIDSNPITLHPISDGSYNMTMKVYDLSGNEIAETVVYPFQVQVALSLFLDIYPNNNGESWAHHQLDTNFTGDVIELRRNDNSIMRFGFDSGEYPLAAMASFVGSGDGLATWWKGQANGLELTNTDAVRQPWLFQSGVLQTLKGEPTLKFEGNHYLNGGDILNINERDFMSVFVGESENSQGTFYAKSRSGSSPNKFSFLNNFQVLVNSSNSNFDLTINFTNQIGIFNQIVDSNHEVYKNDILEGSVPFTGQMLPSLYLFLIGVVNDNTGGVSTVTRPLNGKISELHLYFDEQISNRSLINNLIDNRYNII